MFLSPNYYQNGTNHLANLNSNWSRLIEIVGPCLLETNSKHEPYEALIRAVAHQQLHAKAGDAIISRLINLFNQEFPTPDQILSREFDSLRACGFSGRKIETLYCIANGAICGFIPSRREADLMSDDDLIQRLITLKGIGRWTVEMLLIFTLERLDILPADDFGIAEGYKRLNNLATAPKRKDLVEIGKVWSPYRTIASWYLWRVPKQF